MSSPLSAYPKRLIEVDLPIARISAHARREKSIRHGHISTLHIWWARRPLAACRAVICASLWPDPADPLCPAPFRETARRLMRSWATDHGKHQGQESFTRFLAISKKTALLDDNATLRQALLDFIADFANWDNSTVPAYLDTSRALTQAAHETLGGETGTRPLVVDPFAGGGSIPLEALRVGADAFASDLNPIPVLLNKVVLEYIPKYGQKLADEVRKWGEWIKSEADKELAEFYPKDPDGSTPIAYLWARTILSDAPSEGEIPVEVPLMRSLWLAKKAGRRRALRWVRDGKGKVKTQTVEVAFVEDGQRVVKRVERPLLEIFEPARESDVEGGTVARGSATCPVTGYTTKVDRVRAQLKSRRGGASDARLFCIVTTRASEQGRSYRLPTKADQEAFDAAAIELERREREDGTQRSRKGRRGTEGSEPGQGSRRSLVPDEVISLNELRRISVPIYGMERWGDLFSPRQALALTTLARLVREAGEQMAASSDAGLAEAVTSCLSLCLGRVADLANALCGWKLDVQCPTHLFARQAIGMVWDFSESVCLSESSGSWFVMVDRMCDTLGSIGGDWAIGHIEQASATNHPLPDDAAAALITDPPYYDAVPYAYLSDFFYVWMRRTLADVHPSLFREAGVPKDAEIVVDRPHQLSQSTKDIEFYESELTKAFAEGRRVLAPSGVGTIVFASKTTASWEAILQAVIDAGFVITGSWPIDTEMETRVAAQGQARLASSVHLVCRPREDPDGKLRGNEIGDWRDVLSELPNRIHQWMPRLASEGVVGADAIFACLGPALEIFSRYSSVEKSNGEVVPLREYLEHVWAAVSNEALSMIFKDADAAGLEPDARLTVIWFWVMKATEHQNGSSNSKVPASNERGRYHDDTEEQADEEEESEGEPSTAAKTSGGYSMEFDAARLLAQGMGVELSTLSGRAGILTIKGRYATLIHVKNRSAALVGNQEFLFGDMDVSRAARPTTPDNPSRSARLKNLENRSPTLFDRRPEPEPDLERPYLPGMKPEKDDRPLQVRLLDQGSTILDRLHQSMLLFGRGYSTLLATFLAESGMAMNPLFWRLAQALSALYPTGSDEKRWVDGILARKKSLGL